MTTRKLIALFGVTLGLGLGGCATQGPIHTYTLAPADRSTIHDVGNGATASVPSYLKTDDRLTGFAYDPFTDHFFLRLAPGNQIRVVDRPARKIKREFEIDGMPTTGGGDLAIRPRDGHVFFLNPSEPTVLETSRFGKLIRSVPLVGLTAPARGIAYDMEADRLYVLHADGRRVTRHTMEGARLDELTLAQRVGASLGFDATRQELLAPLADTIGNTQAIGVFDRQGRLLRTAEAPGDFVDVGMRSFLRLF